MAEIGPPFQDVGDAVALERGHGTAVREYVAPAVLIPVAFALRLATRLVSGEAHLLRHGYAMYLTLARTLLHGDGLCLAAAVGCARRMPLYPLLIVPILATGHLFPWLPVTQAAMGSATVWVGWKIALEIADRRAVAVTATCVALNPYAVVHDTGLQETVLFNLLVAVAMYLLLRLRRSEAATTALAVGSVLGLTMLTSGRIEVFLFLAVVWVAGRSGSAPRFRLATLVVLPIVLLVGGWALRNLVAVGAPVLSTEVDKNLWVGNNEWTFSRYRNRHRPQPGGIVQGAVARQEGSANVRQE